MAAKRRERRAAAPQGFQAGPGTVVSIAYELFDAEGEHVEGSEAPLVVLLGYGDAVPALEAALGGLTVGQSAEVTLEPKDAFGHRDPEAIIEVDRADFPEGVAAGDEFEADRDDGGATTLKVLEVADDVVVLDTNHPLAGQRVKLRIHVVAVRPGTAEEIEMATTRLLRGGGHGGMEPSQPLLPAERLLRRVRGEPEIDRDAPPPTPGRTA